MPKPSTTLAWPALFKMLTSALVLLLVAPWGWAQESVSRASAASVDETFSAFRQILNATASDLLASTQHPLGVERRSSNSTLSSPSACDWDELREDRQTVRSVRLRQAVKRVKALRPVFEPILRKEGIRPQMAAIVLVDSGGRTTALSPKDARGIWQLMPDTARRYGLVVTIDQDERLSLDKSTHASARYLRDLHEQFKDWSVVFAAYNAGEQTVQRAIDRRGTTDFSRLNKLLPAETISYVPGVWASLARLGYKRSEGQSEAFPRTDGETCMKRLVTQVDEPHSFTDLVVRNQNRG